ncbi:hypothetical protein AS149_13495 [Burkholderia cenocepacia]|nr:hypothetical protein AS149_13495 [Burkholderia cenocepacia]
MLERFHALYQKGLELSHLGIGIFEFRIVACAHFCHHAVNHAAERLDSLNRFFNQDRVTGVFSGFPAMLK